MTDPIALAREVAEAAASCVLDGETQAYELSFYVQGIPMPKGSMNSFVNPRTEKIVTVFGSKNSRPKLACWTACIKAEASVAATKMNWPCDLKPVFVQVRFNMPRPKSHYGKKGVKAKAPQWHQSKPDLDKLLRTLLDALTGIAFHDDSQVTAIDAKKEFAVGHPGASIVVRKLA